MKTLICTLNSKYIHSSLAPWCLYTACKSYCKSDVKVSVLEATVNGSIENIIQKISAEKPDAVTFSVYIWNKEKTLLVCSKIKEFNPDTVIILGGPEVAYNQKEILENYSFVDFVLSGEGEVIFPEEIDGVSYIKDGNTVIKSEVISESFDTPSPYCDEYLNSLGGRITYIETSRGCPFNCAYCLSGRCGKVKFKPLAQAMEEILLLANSGTKTVKFVDRTFNCNNERATQILHFINDNYGKAIPEGVCFHFEISADILKESFIEEVRNAPAGLFQFEAGIQSLNQATLDTIGRRSDIDKLFENIKKLVALRNCHIHTDLIAGLPKETLQSFIEGFNNCYTLGADMLQLGFLKLLHGSPLREEQRSFSCEFSAEPPYEIISTPTMTKEDLDLLRTAEKEVNRLHNSGRFRRTLNYSLKTSALTPFEFFILLGRELSKTLPDHGTPLDKYTDTLFEVLSHIDGIEADKLRDEMIYDRIATNNSGIIPKSLFIDDKNMKKVKHILGSSYPAEPGTNRNIAILYTKRQVIYCDYEEKDAVSGEYRLKVTDFDFFGETFFDFDIDK